MSKDITFCYHCNESSPDSEIIIVNDKKFCCQGCAFVYGLLNDNGMDDYYALKGSSVGGRPQESINKYNYLDHDDFKKDYALESESQLKFSFYIEGIHCSACLWLLEKLSDFNSDVLSSELDMSASTLELVYKKDSKLSDIAVLITTLGYTPHPILNKQDSIEFEKKENKSDLIRIGVAFACAGNIMLYSFAVYLGAPKEFSDYFNFFSFISALPVLGYCSIPFYKIAMRSFKSRTISVDLPIVVVLLLTFVAGTISLFTEYELYYFDTISILVFLLLSSRYILNIINKKSLTIEKVSNYLNFQTALLIKANTEQEVLSSYLKVGDRIKVVSGSLIPCDCIVVKGKSNINNAALTGESEAIGVKEKDLLYMGAFNNDSPLECEVLSTSEDSRIGKILSSIEKGWNKENSLNSFVDKTTKYFSITVLSLASLFFTYFYFSQGLEIAIVRSFSLLLITCPCALALSTPLAMILSLSIFLKEGIYIKSEKTLEKLTKVKNIFFDKTGTLTDGKFKVFGLASDNKYLDIIHALEMKSNHPIAKSIVTHISKQKLVKKIELTNFKNIPGRGVEASINNTPYYLGKSADRDSISNEIVLNQDDQTLCRFSVEDSLNQDSKKLINYLKSMKLNTFILSGDRKENVQRVGREIGISSGNIYYEQTPEDKIKIIESTEKALMIGDGVNDSSAIQKAFVGVAVSGSVESSLKAADIYFSKAKIDKLQGLILGARQAMFIVKRNLCFSLAYNIFGAYLAFAGYVSPLLAAIFMPISSVTILLLTLLSASSIKKTLKN